MRTTLLFALTLMGAPLANADVKFLATADCQYENGNQNRKSTADSAFNSLFQKFETESGIRGILVAGDLTQNSRKDEFEWYLAGTSKHAADMFEGLGNHDVTEPNAVQTLACTFGLASCVYPKTIANKVFEKKRNTALIAAKNPHYAWRWDNLVFIQLNVFPGQAPAPQFPAISPQDSLKFLQDTLKSQVKAGDAVVLVHHYGFDGFSRGESGEEWWTEQQRVDYWNVLAPYKVAAIISGHVHLTAENKTWYIPWYRPANATGGPDMIPSFVAGAGLNGAYIEVAITADQVQAQRFAANGSRTDTVILGFH